MTKEEKSGEKASLAAPGQRSLWTERSGGALGGRKTAKGTAESL